MTDIPLADLAKRLSQSSWKMLQIIEEHPNLYKKELHETFGEMSRNKFNLEYSKIYGSCLVEEKKDHSDTRYLKINLTPYGKEILKLHKEKMLISE